jgi:hypothetical protein
MILTKGENYTTKYHEHSLVVSRASRSKDICLMFTLSRYQRRKLFILNSVQMCRTNFVNNHITGGLSHSYCTSSALLSIQPSCVVFPVLQHCYESSTGVRQSSPISFSRSCTRFAPVRLYIQPLVATSQSNLEGPLHAYPGSNFFYILNPSQIIRRFDFSRYVAFAMHIDIHYV